MPRTWLRWTPDDGPATTALRRGVNRGLGCLLLATGFVCVSGTWQHVEPTQRLLAGLAGALLLVSALRLLLGTMVIADLVPGAIAVVVIALTPDPTGSDNGFTGALVFTMWLIAAVANLRHRVAGRLLVLSVPAYLLLNWVGATPPIGSVIDMLVLNIGMCFAELAFLGALVRSSRLQDELTEELTRLEIAAALRDLEQTSANTVRRVLHDEVLSALRAIADLPADRQDQVRLASRDAVAAVRRQVVEP